MLFDTHAHMDDHAYDEDRQQLLENLPGRERESDVDVLLLYPDGADAAAVAAKVQELQAAGKTVSAQKTIPEKLRYKTLCRLEGEETV